MQVTVEQSEGLERRLKVALPEAQIKGEVDQRVQKMAKTISMPGFRPGKVPTRVVMQRYGKQLRDEVVGELVQTSFRDAIEKEQLRPASTPQIDEINAEPGSGVEYEARFEVYPEVSLPEMGSLEVARPVASVSDADVENMIETLRKQRKTWHEVDRAAELDDRVTIDFSGTCEGEPIRDGKAENVPVELGAGRMVAGFEDGLVGKKADEDVTLDVTFPEDAPDETVAGKPATFEIHVHKVEESQLPEVNEEFVKEFGIEDATPEGLSNEVRQNLERELEQAVRDTTKRRVLDSLLEKGALEVPEGLVASEVERMISQRKMELSYQGIDPEKLPMDGSLFQDDARRRVALGLLLAEIVKVNDMQADPETVRERIESIASTYDESEKVINYYYGNAERLQEIESSVLEDQVVEWMLERASVSDEESTFDELLNPGQTSA